MYVDSDGDERVLWIRTDASAPAEPEDPVAEETYVTPHLTTVARWSSGTATTDETDNTEYVTDDTTGTLTVTQPPNPTATIFITIHRPPSIADLIARFYDPCADNVLLTVISRFSTPASAYQILSSLNHPVCEWKPTCYGLCGTSMLMTYARGLPTCFPGGAPYLQCLGLAVNRRCLLRAALCKFQGVPGYCDD